LNRQLVTELIDVIYVHENRRITIRLKYQDEFEKIFEFIKQEQETANMKAAV